MRRLFSGFSAALLVAALLLAGCTGDDDADEADTSGGDDSAPAIAEDGLWIGTQGGRVLRIVPDFEDPITGRLTMGQNLPLGTKRHTSVAVDDDGSVWAVAGELSDIVHVDANAIELDRISVPDRETADLVSISQAGDMVWVADRGNQRVLGVDIETLEIAHRVDLEDRPQVILATGGTPGSAVWVGTEVIAGLGIGSIVRIDPVSGSVVARIELPEEIFVPEGGRPPDEGYPVSMTASPGALWFVTYPGGTLNRLDTATGELTATVPVGRLNKDWRPGLATGEDDIWLTDMRHAVILRVDQETAEVETAIPIALRNEDFGTTTTEPGATPAAEGEGEGEEEAIPFEAAPGPLAYLDGSVWVGDFYSVFLYEIDPATNSHVSTMNLRDSPSFATVSDAKFWTMTAD